MREAMLPTRGPSGWWRPLRGTALVARASMSLLRDPDDRVGSQWRHHYRRNAAVPAERPFNTEGMVLAGVQSAIAASGSSCADRSPYWASAARYHGGEILGTAIELLDQHDAALPGSVLPPEAHLRELVDAVLCLRRRATVVDQFEAAMAITGQHAVGATNLCWITTRFMARGGDRSAYPSVPIDVERLHRWSRAVAHFEPHGDGPSDAAGDTYYFWTNAFVASVYAHRHLGSGTLLALFDRGPALMSFVRGSIVGVPVTAAHHAAAALGTQAGRLIAAELVARASGAPAASAMGMGVDRCPTRRRTER
jgi:hypothetical protein